MTVTEQLSALDSILAHGDLHCLFQPILSLSERRLVGYEALTRGPSNSPLHSPLALFAVARQCGRLSELELLCRQRAFSRFRDIQGDAMLFLNVSPESLLEAGHPPGRTLQLLQQLGISPNRVVIELTEQTPIDDFDLLDTALHHYRAMGFSIALDVFGRPQEHPASDVQQMLPSADAPSQSSSDEHGDLRALLLEQRAVDVRTSTQEVVEIFRRQANLNSLAILDEEGRPIGIVHRHALTDALLRPFACDLFLRKPISRLMSDDFLAVELGQTLQQVSRLLTSRARQRIEEDFIVTRGGHYAGMGRVIDVLRLITEEKLQQARHANPLTLLPGNVPIQQCLERLLQQRREAVICYIDVDSFKPFNELYGSNLFQTPEQAKEVINKIFDLIERELTTTL